MHQRVRHARFGKLRAHPGKIGRLRVMHFHHRSAGEIHPEIQPLGGEKKYREQKRHQRNRGGIASITHERDVVLDPEKFHIVLSSLFPLWGSLLAIRLSCHKNDSQVAGYLQLSPIGGERAIVPSGKTPSHLTTPAKDAGQVIGYPARGRGPGRGIVSLSRPWRAGVCGRKSDSRSRARSAPR